MTQSKRLQAAMFTTGLAFNAWLTRTPLRALEARVLTPWFIRLTQVIRGSRQVEPTAEALGREWERLLHSRRTAHVTYVVGNTAYGEISVHCPLRGTGDVQACHRLMAYDRGLLGAVGGQLVVLESQAAVGRTSCRVAIRRAGESVADLKAAHT